MAEFREDTGIYPLMVRLSACLEKEIADSGLPALGFNGLVVGADPSLDCGQDEECGTAWVRLVTSYPSADFPTPDASDRNCNSPIAYDIELGLIRCASPFSDERGNQVTVDQALGQARLHLADMAAMRRAIKCCLTQTPGFEDVEAIVGTFTPTPNQGGCVGGVWPITIRNI